MSLKWPIGASALLDSKHLTGSKCESLSLRYINIAMNNSHLVSITQIEQFLKVDSAIKLKVVSRKTI